jgi:MFS family permease
MKPWAVALARPVPRSLTLASIGLGFFVLAVDSLLLTAGGPSVAGELRGIELVGWLFTAYLLMWTITGPLFGKLSDIHGRRPVLVAGLVVNALGALLAAQAQTMEQVIACRLIQGIGAGAMGPVSYTAAGDLFPPAKRALGQVLFAVVYMVAALVAPPLGGWLVAGPSWRAIFVVDAALSVAAAVAIGLTLREQIERRSHRLDLAGAAALMVGAGSLMLALGQASREGTWASPVQLALYALAAIGMVVFVRVERRAPEPLVPLTLFRSRVIAGSCLVTLSMGACVWAYTAFVPLFVQGVLDRSPFEAGLVALPMNFGWLVTNILVVPLLARWGYRTAGVGGMGALVVGCAILASNGPENPLAYPLVLLALLVQGFGLGFVSPVVVVAVQNAVPWGERGTATAGATFFRSFGPALLISALQAVLNARMVAELAGRGAGLAEGGAVRLSQANALLSPELRATVPPAVLDSMRAALEVGLRETYWLIVVVGLLGCLAAFLLPGGNPERHVWRDQSRPEPRPREAAG